ncbi:FGGY-family carbohydrate kinase [Thioclava sp.]|uniref:FGGY-family carbohydrate kinase n=1 Tax=Thioclava sp. TaxID=1933450 RepID=UPI003242253A
MTDYLLGVDAGNTMVKAAIFDAEGRTIASAARNSDSQQPAPHFVERSPQDLWTAAERAIADCIAMSGVDPSAIRAIGAAGHGNGLYLLDRNGKGLCGIQSMDSRAAPLAAQLDDTVGARILQIAHSRPWPAMTPVLLAWMQAHRPESLADAGHALLCKDVIVHGLTGRVGSDVSDLAGCGLLALPALRYETELLDLYGISGLSHLLPKPAHSHDIVGSVTPQAAAATGLRVGTPVVAGLFDVLASALGAGTARPGEASIVAGSWSINQVFATELPRYPRALLASVLGADIWVSCEASPTSAANLEWFVQQILVPEAAALGRDPFEMCNELAAKAAQTPDAPVFHPFLYAGPVAGARGGFNGLGSWHSRADLVRAVFEGIAFNHLAHFEKLDVAQGYDAITLSGGAAKSRLWSQIFADTFQKPVAISDCEETGARGAAMAAAVGAALFPDYAEAATRMAAHQTLLQPDPAAATRLQRRYRRWCGYRDALVEAWRAPPDLQAAPEQDLQTNTQAERIHHG